MTCSAGSWEDNLQSVILWRSLTCTIRIKPYLAPYGKAVVETRQKRSYAYAWRWILERKASIAVGACVQSFTNHLTPEKDQFGVQNPRISLKKMW